MGAWPQANPDQQTEGCFLQWSLLRTGPSSLPHMPMTPCRPQVSPRSQTGLSLTYQAASTRPAVLAKLEHAPRGPSSCGPARGKTLAPSREHHWGWQRAHQCGHFPPTRVIQASGSGPSIAGVTQAGRVGLER